MDHYAGDVQVGDQLSWAALPVTVIEINSVPMREEDYYGPAKPDLYRFTFEFDDGSLDEAWLYESDPVIPLERAGT